jgi:hypothetical protein
MKLQIPSSKLQGSTKHQAPRATWHSRLGAWSLELPWDLEIEPWSFPSFRTRHSALRVTS